LSKYSSHSECITELVRGLSKVRWYFKGENMGFIRGRT
jgi:hypothetical protein